MSTTTERLVPPFPVKADLMEVDAVATEFNVAHAMLDPERGEMSLWVFPQAEDDFEPFKTPIEPPTAEQVREALAHPQSYRMNSQVPLSKLGVEVITV